MKVLVLGCGPAGLIAAYAARREFDADVKIVSIKRPSQLYGCQYLHQSIPGIDVDMHTVTYDLRGTPEGYKKKVYGSLTPPLSVSPQQYEGVALAWDIRQAYEQLWAMFEGDIEDAKVENDSVIGALAQSNPDHVISSIPLTALCQKPGLHSFISQEVWAMGDAPGQTVPVRTAPFHVLCDGTSDVAWYRSANVFGFSTVEWSGSIRRVPISGVVKISKPLNNDCNCLNRVLRVGRMGRWQKGVLAHQSYEDTVRYIRLREEALQ